MIFVCGVARGVQGAVRPLCVDQVRLRHLGELIQDCTTRSIPPIPPVGATAIGDETGDLPGVAGEEGIRRDQTRRLKAFREAVSTLDAADAAGGVLC